MNDLLTVLVFQAIFQAETRKGRTGVPDVDQRVPPEAMPYAYTRNAARALGAAGEDRIDRCGETGTLLALQLFHILEWDLLTLSSFRQRSLSSATMELRGCTDALY